MLSLGEAIGVVSLGRFGIAQYSRIPSHAIFSPGLPARTALRQGAAALAFAAVFR
jgi:hypothetical protein